MALAAAPAAVAGCSSSAPSSASRTSTLELTLDSDAAGPLQLGEPIVVTVSVRNSGPRSVTAPLELELILPDESSVAFHRTSLFVPFGETASEPATLTTSRWTPAIGTFTVRATTTDAESSAAPASVSFDVVETTRTVPRFEDVTERSGLVTEAPPPTCGQFANGAAWGDVNGDGWPDLAVTRLGDAAQLFVNRRDGTFADETSARGFAASGSNGVAFADIDNDGDADVVLVGDGPDVLLRNDGTGHFLDITSIAGIAGDPASRGMSASWGDYDGDGLLDLFVTNYIDCTGQWDTAANIIANVAYHASVLYHNDGNGRFSDVTAELPDSERPAAGLVAAWVDVDGDGRLDLYLGNDFVGPSPDHNRLWRNAGPGATGWRFEDISLASGAGLFMNTMGIGVGDVDRDGRVDLVLPNIGGNKLLRGKGDGTFVDAADTGVERPSQGVDYNSVTWGTALYDFDLDGWEDVFMAAGNLPQGSDIVVGEQPNMVFLNDGTGRRFLDVSALTGADDVGESKGIAVADYDRDGAADVFVIEQDGQSRLYRNVTPRAGRHWLEIELVGTVSNRDGCGALVRVTVGGDTIERRVLCGSGGTGSANEHTVHVGLGGVASVGSIEIRWPSGIRQVVDGAGMAVDRLMTVVEPAS